jgi:hypothetical protein
MCIIFGCLISRLICVVFKRKIISLKTHPKLSLREKLALVTGVDRLW